MELYIFLTLSLQTLLTPQIRFGFMYDQAVFTIAHINKCSIAVRLSTVLSPRFSLLDSNFGIRQAETILCDQNV